MTQLTDNHKKLLKHTKLATQSMMRRGFKAKKIESIIMPVLKMRKDDIDAGNVGKSIEFLISLHGS